MLAISWPISKYIYIWMQLLQKGPISRQGSLIAALAAWTSACHVCSAAPGVTVPLSKSCVEESLECGVRIYENMLKNVENYSSTWYTWSETSRRIRLPATILNKLLWRCSEIEIVHVAMAFKKSVSEKWNQPVFPSHKCVASSSCRSAEEDQVAGHAKQITQRINCALVKDLRPSHTEGLNVVSPSWAFREFVSHNHEDKAKPILWQILADVSITSPTHLWRCFCNLNPWSPPILRLHL